MPEVKPFRGIVYNRDKVEDISLVVAPPYDVIAPSMQDELYGKDPHNVIRLILGKTGSEDNEEENRYTRAGKLFELWLADRVMVRDEKDCLYICSQRYKAGAKTIERFGFIGLMGLAGGKGTKVLPHENTLSAPKADRLNLMRRVRANLCPIFVLYDDRAHRIVNILKKRAFATKPFIDMKLDGVRNRVWRLSDPGTLRLVGRLMRSRDIFIADGHHRFETAVNYLNEIKDSGLPEPLKRSAGHIMAYFSEADEQTLSVLPAHRVVKDAGGLDSAGILEKLSKFFHVEKLTGLKEMMSRLRGLEKAHAFGMYLGKAAFYLLRLKNQKASDAAIKDKPKPWKRLDVSILHLFIFQRVLGIRDEDDNIEFIKDPKETRAAVDEKRGAAAFFLNPTKVAQVKQIAKLGERMPRKATYFYPKPLSGLVINRH